MKKRMHYSQRGFIVPAILMFMLLLIAIGTATLTLLSSNHTIAQTEKLRLQAQLAADAGADAAIQALNTDGTWTGTTSEQTVMNANNTKTTYSASIADVPAEPLKKKLTVIGRTYSPSTSTKIRGERKYEIELRGVVGGSSFSVVTGVGGLEMENSSKIVGGDVFVNGNIKLDNSAQIGLTTSPVNVSAAHQSCPVTVDSTFPRVCAANENGQPITLKNHAKIVGEVRATNQTTGTNMTNPGLIPNSTVSPLPLPSHDRAGQKAAITTTMANTSANCSGGTKIWPADIKITGNVEITNSCKLTIMGDVWITGNFKISNSSEVKVGTGVTSPPEIMIDGPGGLLIENSSKFVSNTNSPPVGVRVITYWANSSCSPECTNLTGTGLANSQKITTITITNSSSGPQSEFYARWSAVLLTNSGNIGAVVGQTIKMTNSATISFGTSVTNANTTPSAWVVSSYRRLY